MVFCFVFFFKIEKKMKLEGKGTDGRCSFLPPACTAVLASRVAGYLVYADGRN